MMKKPASRFVAQWKEFWAEVKAALTLGPAAQPAFAAAPARGARSRRR
jgi:hypothetical protein